MSASNFSVNHDGSGNITLTGAMTFDNAEAILQRTRAVVEAQDTIVIDLTEVEQTDSASLALLLEWIAMARSTAGALQFQRIPERVLAIAETGEVSDLIRRYSVSS
ncbi:MAG: STAS domain-containing protein [Pseudomonadota bacterium]